MRFRVDICTMPTTVQYSTAHDALENFDGYIWKLGRKQVLGTLAEWAIRFREDHDSILCDSLLLCLSDEFTPLIMN